jgi:tRNA (cmo5U34)-methyltransferase
MTEEKNMADFEGSRWSDRNFSREYLDQADGYIPERRTLVEITKSLYRNMIKSVSPRRILDLGCGDGFMVQELLQLDPGLEGTLVDGSRDMLEAAARRLSHFENKQCLNVSFQDLVAQDLLKNSYCFILSSLAMHHLDMKNKETLFAYAYRHLEPGGFFVNIDVVLSPTDSLESWYLTLWQEWINSHSADSLKTSLLPVPQQYKNNPDNVPDPLLPQLRTLEHIGFKNVDCFYKYGIFAMFGGSRNK